MRAQFSVECSTQRQILKGITGIVGPGEVLALMGPSGSGKTTLLKIIAGRLNDNVKGSVTYNDIPYSSALKRRRALSLSLPPSLPLPQSIYLSIYLYVCPSICLSACLFMYLFISLFVCLSACLFMYLFISLFVCLSVHLFM